MMPKAFESLCKWASAQITWPTGVYGVMREYSFSVALSVNSSVCGMTGVSQFLIWRFLLAEATPVLSGAPLRREYLRPLSGAGILTHTYFYSYLRQNKRMVWAPTLHWAFMWDAVTGRLQTKLDVDRGWEHMSAFLCLLCSFRCSGKKNALNISLLLVFV